MKYNKFDKIEIEWLDSKHETGWLREKNFKTEYLDLCEKTVGYFLRATKHSIIVIQSYSVKEDIKGGFEIDAIMEIPKKAIVKINKLRIR